ncbi:Sugar/inositol transporter [Ophiocordyceps camponoti-floridani]|uniref:Sugar/inositol transporter n=1 Tax=Ophiocordyceps camponoti-floridani TaxID=2030778 RepID=A0A8H4VGV9_9HYPO|nr:Sugar/inositol transporter [Ophiocordyceps camponoti-floridani]
MPPSRSQYRLVLAVPQMPVGLALVCSLFLDDTPRWLAASRGADAALTALARLRGRSEVDAAVVSEWGEMRRRLADEEKHRAESTWAVVREVISVASYRRRFFLGLAVQTVAQWSGGNAITYYIADIFRLAGVATRRHSLLTAGSYGATKLVFTVVFAWGLIDYLGRRRCMLVGLAMQGVAHSYLAVYMSVWRGSDGSASHAAVASVFVYAVGWSVGLCTVQYLYGTEILPTRVRGVCYAVNMTAHWLFQFAVVAVMPAMLARLGVWGAFVFWAAVCAVGLVVLGLWAPETKGVAIENMAALFDGPWYLGWRADSQRFGSGLGVGSSVVESAAGKNKAGGR